MKKALPLVLIFFACNAIGSLIGPLYFILPLKYELVNIASEAYNPAVYQHDMVIKMAFTWLVCAVFSFSAFFVYGIWRVIFLAAPIIIPLIYGAILIQSYI